MPDKRSAKSIKPSLDEEESLISRGYKLIAVFDDACGGALAGPVVAAAVIMPYPLNAPWRELVRDSKLLKPATREYLFQNIREKAIASAVSMIPSDVIDAQNIIKATELAMKQAVARLSPPPQSLLIDHLHLSGITLHQKGITNGDRLCFSIACASIIAKVARDRFMVQLDRVYPGYGLARHKGYGTREHLLCLRQKGPCHIHRHSFAPVREAGII